MKKLDQIPHQLMVLEIFILLANSSDNCQYSLVKLILRAVKTKGKLAISKTLLQKGSTMFVISFKILAM